MSAPPSGPAAPAGAQTPKLTGDALAPARGSRMALALVALDESRAALRQSMLPPPACDSSSDSRAGGGRRWPHAWCRLRRWLRRQPMARLVSDAATAWWRSHPLHPVAELLARESQGLLLPAVQRHPVASVLVAAASGAALVASQPWRWHALRRELRPLPRRAGQWLIGQLGSAPVQAMVGAWLAMTLAGPAAAAARPAATRPPAD